MRTPLREPDDQYRARGNDYLREQLALLDRPDQRRLRQRLTLLEVRCRACGAPAFVVVATRPFWVVRTWNTGPYGLPMNSSVRRDEPCFLPLAPDRKREDAVLMSVCRCQTVERSEAWLWARLDEAGGDPTTRRRITIPGPAKVVR